MTGTGTQTDPYIVDTWEDFRTAVSTSGAYVEVKPNTVWNFNEISPTGLPETTISCAQINGNDCELHHPYVRDNFLFYNASGAIINKLHILKLNAEGVSAASGFFKTYSIGTQGRCNFCQFSGTLSGPTALTYFHSANHQAGKIYYNCSIHLEGAGYAQITWGNYSDFPGFTDCNIIMHFQGAPDRQGLKLIKSQLEYSNDVATAELYIDAGSTSSIIYPTTNGGIITNDAGTSALILADSSGISADTTTTNITLCTPEQLDDATYLTSIGFLTGG